MSRKTSVALRSAAVVALTLLAAAAGTGHASAATHPGCVTPPPSDPNMKQSSPSALLSQFGQKPSAPSDVGGVPAS